MSRRDFLKFFHACMLRSLMQKITEIQPKDLVHRAKNRLSDQKCRFFQSRRYVDHVMTGGKETP